MKEKSRMTVLAGSGGKLVPKPPSSEPEPDQEPIMGVKLMGRAKELADQGESAEAISKALEKSLNWVKGTLLIMTKLPSKVHEAIGQKKFSRTCALQLLLAPPGKLDVIIDGALKLSETEGKL